MRLQTLGRLLMLSGMVCPCISEAQTTVVADTLIFDLDRCLSIALSDNPTIKIADMEIERVDYAKKETIGQLLPSINFGATYNRTLEKQVAYMNMGGFGNIGGGEGDSGNGGSDEPVSRASSSKRGPGIKMGLDNSFQAGFSASMPLIAPQLWRTLKLNDSQILQNVENARASRLSLINQVKSAYYALMLAEDSYKVIQENYDNAVFNHDVFVKKFQVGTASEYDVLRSSVQVKNVEPELLQAEIAIKQARMQLSILLGMDASYPIKAANSLSEYEKDMYEQTLSIDRSIQRNTDLRALDIQTKMLKETLSIQKMSWFPTLSLSASYSWNSSSNGNPLRNFLWTPYSMMGVTFSLPIFEGGQRYHRIKQARVQVDEMAWQRENLERNINMQVDLAMDNIQKNVRQISSSAESVNQAVKAYAIMEKSFEIGAASYLDLRDAELALTQSRLAYYQSIYNYLIANSELEHLLGNADIEKYESNK